MSISILNNVSSLVAENAVSNTQNSLNNTLQQLSTGLKLNSGADDPAGLSIADGLGANIAALNQSSQNASNGIGLLQTADGALSKVTTILNQAVTIATEASNGGLTSSQSTALQTQFAAILGEINQIGSTTNYNGTSVFTGNTATTRAFIPHIDAALVVIGADPPLAGEELLLVEAVARHVQDLIITVNKADRTTDAERAEAVAFARRQLEKRLPQHSVGPLFEISAAEQLEHRGTGRDWQKLVASLQQLVEGSGRRLIRAACDRGLERISEQLLVIISEEREALRRPIDDSERRIAVMKQTIGDAERSMRDLGYLFMGEQQHISDMFVDRHKTFLARVLPQAHEDFDVSLQSISGGLGPSYRRRTFREAQELARRHVLPWLKPEHEEGEKEYRRIALRFVEMANEFLKKLANAGIPELARMPHALDPEKGFRVRSKFTFLEFIDVAQPASPVRWLADLILGLVEARRVIKNDARRFLTRLLEYNSTRVQSDILNRVQESRAWLETEIRKLLHEVSRIAEQALARAKKVREEGASAVDAELQRLDSLEEEVRILGAQRI